MSQNFVSAYEIKIYFIIRKNFLNQVSYISYLSIKVFISYLRHYSNQGQTLGQILGPIFFNKMTSHFTLFYNKRLSSKVLGVVVPPCHPPQKCPQLIQMLKNYLKYLLGTEEYFKMIFKIKTDRSNTLKYYFIVFLTQGWFLDVESKTYFCKP